jgi:hypothetical protein
MLLNGTRECRVCKNTFPLNARHFVANPACAGGLERRCKRCRNIAVNNFKRANSVKLAERRRSEYAADNGSTVRARESRRELRNPFKIRAWSLLRGMRDRAQDLKLSFDRDVLTIDYLERRLRDHPRCECCHNAFEILPRDARRQGPRLRSPSIDRVIPALGYTVANIAILCWRCNNLKRDARPEELETVAAWMRLKASNSIQRQPLILTPDAVLVALSEAA